MLYKLFMFETTRRIIYRVKKIFEKSYEIFKKVYVRRYIHKQLSVLKYLKMYAPLTLFTLLPSF